MDRNEAVLRELNLYPLWVRRDGVTAADAPSPPAPLPTPSPQSSPVNGRGGEREKKSLISAGEGSLGAVQAEAAVEAREPAPVELRAEVPKLADIHPDSGMAALDWPQLKAMVRDCTACRLRAGCMQTVFGVGDEQAEWLFVGEGPGADEDALGEPFVGQAGKLLDNMLLAIGLKRGRNVYIANIVKCRPPGNRNPEPDEITTCLPYLQRQIALIRPTLIVALGKVAATTLLGRDAPIGSLRGAVHDYHGTPLVVTYHPAYLLRSPSEKAKAWQDLKLAVATHAPR